MRGVVLLALLTVCESCAMFECQDLNQVVCAKREKGVILLNSLGCLAGTNCSLSDLLIWDEGSRGDITLLCTQIDPANIVQRKVTKYGYHCGDREPDHDLAFGEHPKRCTSDEECALKDGTFAMCGCSFGVEKYCVPNWDSSVFEGFWDECAQTGSRLYDFGEYYYWVLMKETYTYQQTPVPCATQLFTEFYSLARLSAPISFSLFLGLSWLSLFH